MSTDQDSMSPARMLPSVALTDARTGEQWRPTQLRQKAAQVLCFMHDGCAPCDQALADLADRRDDLRWADTEVRTILERPGSGPFPVVLDPGGEARARILGPDSVVPTLVVADRFTAVTEIHPAPEHAFPDLDRVVTALRLLACDCE